MLGFIHMFARNRVDHPPSKDSIVVRFNAVNHESYDAKLKTISTRNLRSNICATESGQAKLQGNLGTLIVLPSEHQVDLLRHSPAVFVAGFSQQRIEFSLTSNVRIMPAYTFRPTKDGEIILRQEPTIIKFQQMDQDEDCYHEVMLSTRHPSIHFMVEACDTEQHINLRDWQKAFEKFQLKVNLQEGHYELDKTLFVEDVYAEASLDDLISTGVGRAFNPAFIYPQEAVESFIEAPLPLPVPSLTPQTLPDSPKQAQVDDYHPAEPTEGATVAEINPLFIERQELVDLDMALNDAESDCDSGGDSSTEDFSAYFPAFHEHAQYHIDDLRANPSIPPSSTIFLDAVWPSMAVVPNNRDLPSLDKKVN